MKALLSLGSNQGNRFSYLFQAKKELSNLSNFLISSSYMETTAIGPYQRKFINQILLIETKFSALDLLKRLKEIEEKLGRIEREHWGPREIDIDILFYDDLVLKTDKLIIPHKEIYNRRFILEGILNLNSKSLNDTLDIIKYFKIKEPVELIKSLLKQELKVL